MRKAQFAALLFMPLLSVFSMSTPSGLQGSAEMQDVDCNYWWSRVDHTIQLPKNTPEKDLKDEKNVIEAIGCLLKLKGNTTPTTYSAVINLRYLESRLPKPTIELAALSQISEIYYQNRNHANAIVLIDTNGQQNTKESIESAYKSYEAWFEKVKEIGVEKARQQKLDPLSGTDVRWQ